MNEVDGQYLVALDDLVRNGIRHDTRAGATRSLFGHQMRFDLQQGFPLLTTKKLYTHAIIVELLWFLRGGTNVKELQAENVHIWDEWSDANGDLGPVYGKQWRSWPKENGKWSDSPNTIDQISLVLEGLARDPFGRRHIVTAWNPAEIEKMALPPCHCLFQFHVRPVEYTDGPPQYFLDCHLYQRSADWFLGVPFNIASYALLTQLIAREVGMVPGTFIHSFGDYHLYETHIDQAREQLSRVSRPLPRMEVASEADDLSIFDLTSDCFTLVGYDPHPAIKAEVSV